MSLPLIRTLSRTCFKKHSTHLTGIYYQPPNLWIRLNSSKESNPTSGITTGSGLSFSNDKSQQIKDSSQQHGKYSRQAVRQNVQGYVFTRYIDYLKNYDKLLEKQFPKAARVYHIFFDGVKLFLNDLKYYLKIWRIVNISSGGLESLNRKEIELYMQMPRDMIKVAPTLLISALPFVGYAIFPIAYAKPRYFLTAHFWTIQQKTDFQLQILRERLSYNKAILRFLQLKLKSNKPHPLYQEWRNILGQLGSGQHPTVEQIISVKNLFSAAPYSFKSLPSSHIKNLCRHHGISASFFKRNRLLEHAYLIHHMDLAIKREGDVHNMEPNALRKSCYLRGLNPSNLTNEQMISWLRNWLEVSLALEEEHIGLFVHLQILLTYNNPNNWKLIY
ncbi:LETM1 domain-containing protein 1 [Condylostylus longicornis]|uniref:LETM1 domain-containing protein 1 n=1 Tax=Condylostylus longicornis TaxID=2530218 RepID=UPI00244DC1D8|nr:LETM1 domain-containing protein 1 [Condylostylus longicornis]